MKLELAGIKFNCSEIESAIRDKKTFIAKGRFLYEVKETRNGTIARKVYKEHGSLPLTSRGRFVLLTAKEANKLIGCDLCLA